MAHPWALAEDTANPQRCLTKTHGYLPANAFTGCRCVCVCVFEEGVHFRERVSESKKGVERDRGSEMLHLHT